MPTRFSQCTPISDSTDFAGFAGGGAAGAAGGGAGAGTLIPSRCSIAARRLSIAASRSSSATPIRYHPSMLLFVIALAVGEFRLAQPPGWTATRAADGFEVSGPSGTAMRITVYTIKGGTADADGATAAKKVGDAALTAIRQIGLVQQIEPKVRQFNNGTLEEALYTSQDDLRFLTLYVLTGKRDVVVITIEGGATHIKEILPVRAAIVDALGGK